MENGALASPESSSAAGSSSTPVLSPYLNGVSDMSFRDRLFYREKQELLAERQRLIEQTDQSLLSDIKLINERKEERKHMLKSRVRRQQEWYRRRRDEELERLDREMADELNALPALLYNQLEKLKETIQEKVKMMNVLDRRTLNVVDLADKPLDLEQTMVDEDDAITESPTAVIMEKRDILPGRLTADAAIKEDLLSLNQSTTPTDAAYNEVARLVRRQHKVALDRSRLIYDGKTFYRGQKLFVQTTNYYTRFPAIIALLADEYVHIKARMPGDTRDVYATIDDLRSGRVRIGRKGDQIADNNGSSTITSKTPHLLPL